MPFSSLFAQQTQQQYLYDVFGRLIRVIRSDGLVVTYTYDDVGNLLSITSGTVSDLGPPTINSITPDAIRIGGKRSVEIKGSNFLGGSLKTDNPGIEMITSQITNTQINTLLSVASGARVGTTTVTITTPLGERTGTVQVMPSLLTLSPAQLTVNKGESEKLTLSLVEPVVTSTLVTLASSDPAVATVPDHVTLDAGTTTAIVFVQGVKGGFVAIRAQIGDDDPVESYVYVKAPFSGPAVAATESSVSVFYPHMVGQGVAATQSGVSVFYPHMVGQGVTATQSGVSVFYPHMV